MTSVAPSARSRAPCSSTLPVLAVTVKPLALSIATAICPKPPLAPVTSTGLGSRYGAGAEGAACYVLRATSYVLRPTCYFSHATCYFPHATCDAPLATCDVLRATCDVLRATHPLLGVTSPAVSRCLTHMVAVMPAVPRTMACSKGGPSK